MTYEPAEVCAITILDQFNVRFEFKDGTIREIDLWPYIKTGPIFDPVRSDPTFFRRAFVDGGTIAWPNEADIDPDVLYLGLPPDSTEEQWRAAIAAMEPAQP